MEGVIERYNFREVVLYRSGYNLKYFVVIFFSNIFIDC